MSEVLVRVDNLSKVFTPGAPPALDGISTEIRAGQFVGLAGPDGAGKTTLIRMVAGLLQPTQGSVTIAGYDTVKDANVIPLLIGYMPQRFGLYEDLTVIQNLNLYADLGSVVGEERKEAFERLLRFTGLSPFKDRLAGALSGGMKQKLGLACTLIRKPTLLLLDEPSVGVDPFSRRELWKMVHDLLKENIAVVWSTAYLDEAAQCDTVLLLNEGKRVFQGDPQILTERVKGRVFKVSIQEGSRRQLLKDLLNSKEVVDGVMQGRDLRIVTKEPLPPQIDKAHYPNATVSPIPPRFEDAFIDLLGGVHTGSSILADHMPEVKEKMRDVIVAEDLTKKFGDFTAASDISFKVPPGKIFGLIGPNGAGKSTTFKMLCGLLKPTHGQASVIGYDLQTSPGAARAAIGYMAQKFSLYGDLSVLQNLEFFSGIYTMSGKRQRDAVNSMVEIFGLKPYLNEVASLLPLGFKQRLALSCSTMHNPSVLFLDEPSSGVDPLTRREFWNHINGVVGKGVTVMVTTHFLDEAEYCDTIALIYRGKVIKMGSPEELKESAQSQENSNPTLEDAFIKLIEKYDAENPL